MVEFSDLFEDESDVFQKKAKVCTHTAPLFDLSPQVSHSSHLNTKLPRNLHAVHVHLLRNI